MTRWTRPLYGPLQPGRLHRGPLPLMFGLWVAGAMWFVPPATASIAYMQETPADTQRTVWDGVYTEGQVELGAMPLQKPADLLGPVVVVGPSQIEDRLDNLGRGGPGAVLGTAGPILQPRRPVSLPARQPLVACCTLIP